MMLDSNYDRIELIRGPLKEGTTWTQEVEGEDGGTTTLECTIEQIESDGDSNVYTVLYEDMNSPYYEKREMKENTGIISFEKLMLNDSGNYEVSYRMYDEGTGLHHVVNFNDVSMDDWYVDYIAPLVPLAVIDGYPDQTFRPGNPITVAEFLKATLYSLSYTQEKGMERWYDPFVEKSIDLGLIAREEYSDYNRPITREEMTGIIVKALGEAPSSGEPDFSDTAQISEPYMPYVEKAVELGVIEGYPSDNSFRPRAFTTRAEAAKMFNILVQKVGQNQLSVESALSLEREFESRLYQNKTEDWKVEDFDTKEELIVHIMAVLDNRALVERYVDRFYKQDEDGLYLVPMDGLAVIREQKPYQLVIINPRVGQLVEEDTNALRGHYKLTITFQYNQKHWIMKDRDIVLYDHE